MSLSINGMSRTLDSNAMQGPLANIELATPHLVYWGLSGSVPQVAANLLWKEREWKGKLLLRAVKRSHGGKANEGSNFPNSLYPKSRKNS